MVLRPARLEVGHYDSVALDRGSYGHDLL
eukprot:COSAG05_NODE_24607_length_242_cov_2328.468531_2_plen_28_part_01